MPVIEKISKGYKNCLFILDIMKNSGQFEFSALDINNIIAKYVGFSLLSRNRYFNALIQFNMIKKLESGKYTIVQSVH